MAKLLTGTRIYGTGTVDTQLFVSGTNSATSTTTGALQVVGGVGIGGNLYVGGTIFGGTLSGTASTATNSDNVKTVLQTSSSSHYLTFVDANNSTAAYEALYTTSSFVINPQSGFVGIGTASPSTKLHVYESSAADVALRLTPANGSYDALLQMTGANGAIATEGFEIWYSNTVGDVRIATTYPNDAAAIRFHTRTGASKSTSNERLTIAGNGNVGIGTNSPSYPLHLLTTSTTSAAFRNSTSTTTQILIGNTAGDTTIRTLGSGDSFIFSDTSKYLAFGTGATERLRITANGGISFGGSGTAYGVSGQILQSNGDAAPTWISTGSLAAANATTATHLSGGVAGQIPYQTALGVTAFLSTGTAGDVLVSNGSSAATYNNTLRLAGSTNATSTTSGALQVVGGVGVGGDLFIQGDIRTNDTLFNLINGNATTVNFAGDATTLTMGASGSGTTNVRNNLTVSGNLTVQGTTTIVDSTVTNIADPIITLGGGTGNSAPTADDNKDRGVAFKYVNNAGTTSTGFFGYDDSTGHFTYVQTATITNEVVSGTKGAMDVNLAGGTAMSVVYQSSPNNTAFLAASTSGYLLQTNGTGSAPTWVSASGVSAGSATYADNVRTIAQTGNAAHFLTFVDSNNASNTYESLYTTSSFSINPATGNVGIGTSTATYALTIVNSSPVLSVGNLANTGGSIYLGNSNHGVNRGGASGSNDVSLYTTAGNLYLSANGLATTSHLTVSNAGNVNIGTFTTSIAKKFTVVGEGNFTDASNTTRLYMGYGTIPGTGSGGAYVYNSDNSPLAFGTTNTERMRIDTLGTVGIGETTPATYATTGSLVITNTTFRPEIALRTTTAIGGTTAIKLGATSSIPQGGAVISSYISAVSGQPTDLIFSLVTSGTLTERLRITSNGGIAFSGTNTYGTSGFVLKSNGDAAPTWVNASTLASGSATNADNIRTVAQTANASYFPAFVDSNNAANAYELVYTTSSFSINPGTGLLTVTKTAQIGTTVAQGDPSATDITANATLLLSGIGGNYLSFGQKASNLAQWIQSGYLNPTTAVYPISLNPLGGNVGIGTLTPGAKLEVSTAAITNATAILVGPSSGTATLGDKIVLGFKLQNTAGGGTGNTYAAGIAGVVDAAASNSGALAFYTQTSAGDGTPERMRITRNGGISFGASGTAYGTSGQILKSNGDAAPTWVSSISGSAGQVSTVLQTASASYFPTFVDSNNASATAESFYTTSSFVINPQSGNVGIGTSSPSVKLHIRNDSATVYSPSTAAFNSLLYLVNGTSGASTNALMVFVTESNGEWYIGGVQNAGNTAADFIWASRIPAGRAERMRITSDGNVGIGTSSPSYPLVVQTNGTSSSPTPQGSNIALRLQSTQTNYAVSLQFSDNVTNAAFITMQGGGFRFTTSNPGSVQAMNISSGGNVSIGTTSTTNKFEVAGTAGQLFSVSDSFTGTIFSVNDVSGIPSIEVLDTGLVKLAQYNGQLAIGTGTVASSTATVSIYGMLYTMGTLGEIRASSEITAYFSSDRRLKENIKLIENPITIIDQIRGVTFDWTDEHMARRGGEDGYFVRKHDIGVIAQEVQAVLPELVGTREDGYLAVKYEKMVPLLIEAIKVQQKTIDSLVKDLDTVKEFINQLKK